MTLDQICRAACFFQVLPTSKSHSGKTGDQVKKFWISAPVLCCAGSDQGELDSRVDFLGFNPVPFYLPAVDLGHGINPLSLFPHLQKGIIRVPPTGMPGSVKST